MSDRGETPWNPGVDLELFPEDPDERLPDFILCGAQKSGTTTLNYLLGQHPEVFLEDDGKFFFNVDHFVHHPAFYPRWKDRWTDHDLEEDFDTYFRWYCSIFEEAGEDQLIGEDSPLYFPSRRVPRRIKRVLPEVKLLFILRNPVDRVYSNYWHEFRNGRATYSFEGTLQYEPEGLVEKSFYEESLRRYYEVFDADQIKVILFEEFVEEMQQVLDEVFEFLGLEPSVDVEGLDTHQHSARAPRSVRLQLWLNWLFRDIDTHRYHDQLPGMPDPPSRPIQKAIFRSLCSLNLTRSRRPPDMKESTRAFLGKVLARENRTLGDLIDRDLSEYWPMMGPSAPASQTGPRSR